MLRTLYSEDSSRISRRGEAAKRARAVKVRKIPYAPYVEQWPVIMPSPLQDDVDDGDSSNTLQENGL